MNPVLEIMVTQPGDLESCCARLSACDHFGLDMEFVGEESYHPHLCLIQIATEDALYLIDPLAVPALEPLWKIIADPARTIVVHAGREEVRLCHLWSGQTPGKLFDLQIAAGLAGFPYPLGHGPLVSQVLGIQLFKGETLTEWRTRPLTPAQVEYAFDDVRYLLEAWRKLAARLDELGRMGWGEEEFARLCSQATPTEPGLAPGTDRWRKLRGAGQLDRRRLALLRDLFLWREQQAAQANRPARTFVRDDLLVEIARRFPRKLKDIQVVRGLPRRHAEAIFQVIEQVRHVSPEDCPLPFSRERDPPQLDLATDILRAVLNDHAARIHLAPNLAATSQDLKLLVRSALQNKPLPPGALLAQGWRGQHILPRLRDVLEGKKHVRIADLRAEAPLEISE